MFRKGRSEKIKEKAASASALALVLAKDKRFRKRLRSAIEHGAKAGRRTRQGFGLSGAVGRLASDQTLLDELSSARKDLQSAYGRMEAKRRGSRRRKVFVFLGLVGVAMPAVRARLRPALSSAWRSVSRRAASPSTGSAGNSARPKSLEALTKEELYARAEEAKITGRSKMTKEELIEALRTRR